MSSLKESVDRLLALPEEKQRKLAKIALKHLKERAHREGRRAKKSMRRAQ